MEPSQPLDASTALIRLGVTLFFVATNGFFVAAEFALVKVRPMRLRSLAEAGSGAARVARHVHGHLDRYPGKPCRRSLGRSENLSEFCNFGPDAEAISRAYPLPSLRKGVSR